MRVVVVSGREAVGGVPRVVAADPRQVAGDGAEGGEQVEEDVGDDDVVVHGDQPRHGHHREAETCGDKEVLDGVARG